MALQAGLYKSQDQQEQDLTDGPGWTIDDEKPGTFSGFGGGVVPALRGVGQGAAEGISMLTHGFQAALPTIAANNPFLAFLSGTDETGHGIPEKVPGWKQANEGLENVEDETRDYAKSLTGDPRTTGSAANLVQGFSKAVTEFGAGTLAGGPVAGASLMGATEGYGHYADLLDQGVDEDTATKSGLLTAIASGGSALMPMGMPARWVAGLSTAGTLLAQAGAGAAINASTNVASRYASAQILRDAGYDSMADQAEVWDKTNLLTDAISGAFFGAHAGWHGLKELDSAHIDPSVRDAAKVVQDRQAVLDGAPGVPIDMKSAAVNKDLLESSLGDLLNGRAVDTSGIDSDGATFATHDVDDSVARQIIRDEFVKSGVLEDAEAFDRWLSNGFDDEKPEAKVPETEPEPPAQPPAARAAAPDLDQHPDVDTVNKIARDKQAEDGSVVAEQTGATRKANGVTPMPEPAAKLQVHEMDTDGMRAEADQSDAKDVETLQEAFGNEDDAKKFRRLAASNADSAYDRSEKMLDKLTPEQRAIVDKWEQKTPETPRFDSSEMRDIAKNVDRVAEAETPGELAGSLAKDLTDVGDKTNPAEMNAQELTAYMRLKRAMELAQEKGWNTADISRDAIQASARRFGDPIDAEFMLSRFLKTEGAPAAAIHDRPKLAVVDENGEQHSAALTYDSAVSDEAQANAEAEPMHKAAVACEARHA